MMTAGILMLFGYYLKIKNGGLNHAHAEEGAESFDIFKQLERSEWDTLMLLRHHPLCRRLGSNRLSGRGFPNALRRPDQLWQYHRRYRLGYRR